MILLKFQILECRKLNLILLFHIRQKIRKKEKDQIEKLKDYGIEHQKCFLENNIIVQKLIVGL